VPAQMARVRHTGVAMTIVSGQTVYKA